MKNSLLNKIGKYGIPIISGHHRNFLQPIGRVEKVRKDYLMINEREMKFDRSSSMDEILKQLEFFNDRLGPEYDLNTTIDKLKETIQIVEEKNLELRILSFFAFHANDENLIDLRKQLFLQTKMMYHDKIQDVIEHFKESSQFDDDCESSRAVQATSAMKDKRMFHDLIEYIHEWIYSFKKTKNILSKRK